jgi:hypothetical protein
LSAEVAHKEVLQSPLCVIRNLPSMFHQHIQPHHTWDISCVLSMSHILQSKNTTTLAWMDQASANWSWFRVLQCSQKQWMVSLQVSLAAVHVQPLSACCSEGWVEYLCEIFFPPHEERRIQNQTEHIGNQPFHSLPCLTADWETISHSVVTPIHIMHVTVTICHNFWLYHVGLFNVKLSYMWRIMNVSQHADVGLVQPLYWMSPHLSLSCI